MKGLFQEFPFALSGAIVAAGGAAWFGWSWLAILLALVVGAFAGAAIDESSKKR
jgi:divalent metal cation (Fe/Co/Zn/Cd) transporter